MCYKIRGILDKEKKGVYKNKNQWKSRIAQSSLRVGFMFIQRAPLAMDRYTQGWTTVTRDERGDRKLIPELPPPAPIVPLPPWL